ELNGSDTVKEIRALGFEDTPIIAFTAIDDPNVHAEAIEAGCNEVLTKPLHPKKLLQKIERFLS
ncbi:MAG: response regulator, partial [Bdellovibrionales bacterium]|nr:response regulator [Bdellovibrionales bacterium]